MSPWSPANNWHCFWVRFRALKRIVVFRVREVRPHNFWGDSCLQGKSIAYQTTTLWSLKRDTGLSLKTFLAGCIVLHWAGYTGVKIPNEDPCLFLSIKEYWTFQLISLEIRVHLNEMSPGTASPRPGPPCCAPLRTAHITRNARQLVFINWRQWVSNSKKIMEAYKVDCITRLQFESAHKYLSTNESKHCCACGASKKKPIAMFDWRKCKGGRYAELLCRKVHQRGKTKLKSFCIRKKYRDVQNCNCELKMSDYHISLCGDCWQSCSWQ